MDLTPEELALLQAIIDGNSQPPAPNMRRQEGETVDAYRARLEAAQGSVQPSAGSQEMNAMAEDAMDLMTPEDYGTQLAVDANPILTRVLTASQGIPFAGEWMDNARALTLGEEQAQLMRDVVGRFEETNPKEAMALQLGTGVAATIPMVLAAAPYVAGGAGSTLLGQTVRGGVTGLLGGGVEGAISGAGEEGDRLSNAVTRGAVGAGLGGILGLLAPPTMAAIGNMLRDPAETAMVGGLGASPTAARFLSRVLGNEDQAVARQALGDAGPTGMLVDASPRAEGVLDAIIRNPETSSEFARRIDDRATTVMGDMTQALDDTMGKPRGLISIEEAIRTNARPEIRRAYDAAYSTPINYAAPEGVAIESLINRLPPQIARKAISRANDRMRFDGGPPNQIMAQIADDGTVTFQEMPNVMQLDYMKRAFDSIARDGTDAVTGAMTDDAQFAAKIARELRNATREAVPVYGDALELAADDLSQRAAVEFGQRILSGGANVTREQVQRAVKDATGPELEAMRAALRSQIDERLANVRRIASDPRQDIEGRQLNDIFGQLNSEAAQDKLRTVLGPDADIVISQIAAAQRALGLKAATARGSQTFGRGAVQGLLDELNQPNAVQSVAMGRGIDAGQQVVQALTNVTQEGMTQQSARVLNEIADILTRQGNVQALDALKIIQAAANAQPVTQKQAYQVAAAVNAAIAGGAYQQGSQNLTGQLRGLLAQ